MKIKKPKKTKITLKGNPKSTQHIYRSTCKGGFHRRYMIPEGVDIKEFYQLSAKQQWKRKPMLCPCKVEVRLYFETKRKVDLDNFNKLWADSLEGVVYANDNQIAELNITKFYCKENPRIELEIEEL